MSSTTTTQEQDHADGPWQRLADERDTLERLAEMDVAAAEDFQTILDELDRRGY